MVIEACRAMLTERCRLMCKQRGRQHHVLGEHRFEVTTTEDEEPVETLSAGRAYESLGDRVRTWRSHGRLPLCQPPVRRFAQTNQ
jgi:hypothetical protein